MGNGVGSLLPNLHNPSKKAAGNEAPKKAAGNEAPKEATQPKEGGNLE